MALSNTTTNILHTQYFDDWYAPGSNTSNTQFRGEELDFHRILFRPKRVGVQTRELTQVQTILQNQLERLGKSTFKDGEAVTGGQLTLDTKVMSGVVESSTNLENMFARSTNTGKFVIEQGNTAIQAKVVQYVGADEGYGNTYLVFKPMSADTFSPTSTVQDANDASLTASFVAGANSSVFSDAAVISIDSGVFFISGFFVRIAPQTVVISPTTNHPNAKIGLEIEEQIVDELDDVVGYTLLDPACANAPGAHRLKIKISLAMRDLASNTDSMFIELGQIINGVLVMPKSSAKVVRMDELTEILARRTYDESGNYITKAFTGVVGNNTSDSTKFSLSIGSGKAYLQGYEITTYEPTVKVINKGRTTATATNRSIATSIGNYVYASRFCAANLAAYCTGTSLVDIHCVNVASITTTSNTTYHYSKIGTVKLRQVEPYSTPANAANYANSAVHKLLFYDATFDTLTGNITSATVNGTSVTITTAIAPGLPPVNNAITGASIILSGDNSPVSGSFTIRDYVANSTFAQVSLNEFVPILPNSNTQYQLVFQARDIDAFAAFDNSITSLSSPYRPYLALQADADVFGKVGNEPTGNTTIVSSNENTLLFQIPERFPKTNTITTNTAVFAAWINTTSNTRTFSTSANTPVTLTLSGNNYSLATGNVSASIAQDLFLVYDITADTNGRGQLLPFVETPNSSIRCLTNVSVSSVGSDFNITFTYCHGTNFTGTRSFVSLTRTNIVGLPIRAKTLIVGNTTHALSGTVGAAQAGQIEFYTLNVSIGASHSLKTTDVVRVKKILYKASNTAFANSDMSTATDVTDFYALDNGQRDNTYEYASIRVLNGAGNIIRPTGRLLVVYDAYTSTGAGYATVDSYLTAENITNGVTYDTLPVHISSKTGRTIALRDALDFRPVRSDSDFIGSTRIFAANNTSSNLTYLTATTLPFVTPASDDVWIGTYDYYLGRIDKIGLTPDGKFVIVEGTPAQSPKAPKNDENIMLLFQVTVPPYTLCDTNNVPLNVVLKTYEYKRYTMQDLSSMDNRLTQLQYYTALNSLESLAANTAVYDENGNERYKNGILVDTFQGTAIANVVSSDYSASIDTVNHDLRTAFTTTDIGFVADTTGTLSANVTHVGDMIIPAYTTTPFIVQGVATHAVSVNPFDVASYYGTLNIMPSVDTWKDSDSLPAQVIETGDTTSSLIGSTYTVWGDWEITWSGISSVKANSTRLVPDGWTEQQHDVNSMSVFSWNDVTTSTIYNRQGTTYEYTLTSSATSIGNYVVDTSVIYVMRSRDIVYNAVGMKPDSIVYEFFDGVDVTAYNQRANLLTLDTVNSNTFPSLQMGQTLYVKKALSGNVNISNGSSNVTGTSTLFQYEQVPGLYMVKKGVTERNVYMYAPTTNTLTTSAATMNVTLTDATLYALVPVTLAAVSTRTSGNTVTATLSVVRATDSGKTSAIPYTHCAGSLRPENQVNDAANTTFGCSVIVPADANNTVATELTIDGALCVSGVVRSYTIGTGALRFDNDITDTVVSTPGTRIRFVYGLGAGTFANVVSYHAANQTAILDNTQLVLEANSTIYSIETPKAASLDTTGISEYAGSLSGIFHIPANAFSTGDRVFRITNSATNNIAEATTFADATYTASGLLVTSQETILSTREMSVSTIGTAIESYTASQTEPTAIQVSYVDPLAETFLVDGAAYPQGVFISSIDVCFAKKPSYDTPVTVEIRPVVNGYPSSTAIVPCVCGSGRASVTLHPDQVNTSAAPAFDSVSTVTTFTFHSPIYLQAGTEYAMIIRSDSSEYYVYTAELSASIIGSESIVSKQPYAGSFFKSQNASTWSESPYEDLMFRVNKCVWPGSATAPFSGVFVGRGVTPTTNTICDSLTVYPFAVEFGNLTSVMMSVDIKPANTVSGDLTGMVATRTAVSPNEWQTLASRSLIQGQDAYTTYIPDFNSTSISSANTIDAIVVLTTQHVDVAPYIDIAKAHVVTVHHYINELPITTEHLHIANPGSGYLVTSQTGNVTTNITSTVVTGNGTTFTATLAIGDTVIIGGNTTAIVASVTNATHFVASSNVGITLVANTYATYGALGGNNVIDLTITSNTGSGATAYAIISRDGTVNNIVMLSNGSAYAANTTVSAPAPGVVAGYTLPQVTAVVEFNGEDGAAEGNGLSRYITKTVTLADDFDASDMKVIFDAYRPTGTGFKVYYKVMNGDDEQGVFDEQPWRLMQQITPDTTVSQTDNQYKEFEFGTPNNMAMDRSSDTTTRFKYFAVKIVLLSNNPPNAPRISNLRCLALDE